jgi:AbrB family looped-hinge helix DNA binding protein
MPIATLTSKGQITLPQAVRDALGLKTGDKVDFVPQPDGGFRVLALRRDVSELKGLFAGRATRAVSIDDMASAIEAEVAARQRRPASLRAAEPGNRRTKG